MTKIKLFQLRLFRTIRRQICSIDMIDIETFTNIFRLLNQVVFQNELKKEISKKQSKVKN